MSTDDVEYVATAIVDTGTAVALADIAAPLKRMADYLKKANPEGPDIHGAYESLKSAIAFYAGVQAQHLQFLDDAIQSAALPAEKTR